MSYNLKIMIAVAQILAVSATVSRAADFLEDFEGWANQNVPTNVSHEGWVATNVFVRNTNYTVSTTGAVWLHTNSAHLRTPLLTNGFGSISFDYANNGSGSYPYALEISTNGGIPWTVIASFTNTLASKVWTNRTVVTNIYQNVYLRIAGGTPGGSIQFGIDNFRVREAPAKVDLGAPYTDPPEVYVNQQPHIYIPLAPSALATVTNVHVVHTALGETGTNAMSETGTPNLYRTVNPLPAQTIAKLPVSYTVRVEFSGTNAASPVSTSSVYTVLGIPFASEYTTMQVIGDISAGMTLIGDNLWRGVAALPDPLSSVSLQFRGVHTNGVATNTWGDAAPVSATLIARGTATTGTAAMTVGPLPAGQIGFEFNAADGTYEINDVAYQDFDAWDGAETNGTHEYAGWRITAGRIFSGPDSDDRIRGIRSAVLSTNAGAALHSPELPGGIGFISFWMRHWNTPAQPATACTVQVSETGGTNASEWIMIGSIDVNSPEYNRFAVPFNSRVFRYARLAANSSPGAAEFLIDEFMIASPGAGVVLSNLTHTPAEPAFSNSVSIRAEAAILRGAAITNMTAWWRGGDPEYAAIAMVEAPSGVWTTVSDIPAAQGDGPDGLGGGDVLYYVSAGFGGYLSAYGSPANIPSPGPDGPAVYSIQSARVVHSNVVHVPELPVVNTSFNVSADILPVAGAGLPNPTLYYRTGSTGGFSTVMMTTTGNYHFAAISAIPVPSYVGSPVQYYLRTTFGGPSALSPAFYPEDGPDAPVIVLARPVPLVSAYSDMGIVSGDFSGALHLIGNGQWRGIISLPSSTLRPSFTIRGVGASTNVWGDNGSSASVTPVYRTAVIGQNPIGFNTIVSGNFLLMFNENSSLYSLRRVNFQGFSEFTPADTFTPGVPSMQGGWTVMNATVFNTNGAFTGNTLRLGGVDADGTNSYVQSPSITGGVAGISFWYRNLADTGSRPGHLDIRVRSAAAPEWQTLGSLTNILAADYLFHETIYASSASNIEAQVIWRSEDNPSMSLIAVDDLAIEMLSSYTIVTNVTHSPPSPAFTNSVTISANITPTNLTGLTAAAWYRPGTSGAFAVAAMTNTGGNAWSTVPPIPPTEPGIVQYYIETVYNNPHGEGPYALAAPSDGRFAPLSFTNSNVMAAFTGFDTSDGWVFAPAPSSQVNSAGWSVKDAFIRGTNFAGGAQAAFLNAIQSDAPHIQTPWLPLGVGAIEMSSMTRGGGSAEYEVLVSTNQVDWDTVAVMTEAATNYTTRIIPLNIEHGVFVRILNTWSSLSGAHLAFDHINITYPLATVAITNVAFHPHYPSGTDPVHITCAIESATEFTRAYDITARVYYKLSTTTNWSGPVEMTNNGSAYITASAIPAHPVGSTVHYHIESTFKGYRQFYSYSPTTSPANPDVSPHSYTTRAYASSFDTIRADTGASSIGLYRIADNFWEGMLQFNAPTNRPVLQILGFGFYDGTNTGTGLSAIWGDNNVFRTNLPLFGTAQLGGLPIEIPEDAQGQYVIRFDESSQTYSVQRLAFQNFDTWPASDLAFEESFDSSEIKTYPQAFDTWSQSEPVVLWDVFEDGWTNVQTYPFLGAFPPEQTAMSPAGWYRLLYGVVVSQLVGNAVVLTQTEQNGLVEATSSGFDSAGQFSFDARAALPGDFRPAIYTDPNFTNVRITVQLQSFDLPTNTPSATVSNSFGRTYKSLIAGYLDDNNYYEVRLQQVNATQKRFELWRRINGITTNFVNGSAFNGLISINDTFSLHVFHQSASVVQLAVYDGSTVRIASTNVPMITNGFGIGVSGMDAGISLAQVNVFEITNITHTAATNELYAENFTSGAPGWTDSGGVWTVTNNTYRRPGYTGPPLSLDVDISTDRIYWSTWTNFAGIAHSEYRRYTVAPHQASNVHMRIRHQDGAGHLIIDNIRSESWRGGTVAGDGWTASNAWVTAGRTENGLELRGSRALPEQRPYQFIQSPVISNGVAVVSFDYKSVTGASNQLVFAIEYTHTNAPNNWEPYLQVTNNPAGWTTYSRSIERELRPQIHRLRIRNASTDPAAGILLDTLAITEPPPINEFTWWGYNVLITDKQTSQLAPLSGNIKGAYLNNAASNAPIDGTLGTAGISYTSYYPFIQSAYLPDGIGEISFWYRGWNSTPSMLEVTAATNRLQPDEQWTVITNIVVTNSASFRYFSSNYYDRDSRYVKLRINTSSGSPGRIAIDDVRIAAPFAADLRLKNLRLSPEIPRFNDNVYVSVQMDQFFFNPVITGVRLYFKSPGTNDWGVYTNAMYYDMVPGLSNGVLTYQTINPIPPTAVDNVIQYQVEASFEGFFSQYSSPKRYRSFVNPDHYWPVDLNRDQPNPTPYYYSFANLPGQVWINELNIADDSTWNQYPAGQFVEIVGKGGVSIGKWRLESINPDYSTNAAYAFAPGTLIGTASNDYGFIVFGQPDVSGRDRDLTNALPKSGGVQLVRSMGAIEQQVSYDTPLLYDGYNMSLSPDHKFVYAGEDNDWFDAALTMIGTGSNLTEFSWWAPTFEDHDRPFSIGTTNAGQFLIPWPDASPDPGGGGGYTGTAQIASAWRGGGRVTMQVTTQSENLLPVPWYATNLMNSPINWYPAANPSWSRTGTTYTVSGDAVTNAAKVFYTVTVTGTE